MLHFLRIFCLLAVACLISGCVSERHVDYPPLSFSRYQPIYLNVSSIEFVETYQSSMQMPYVEHLIPYSPSEAMHIWAKDRLRAIGKDGMLQIIIRDGSVIASDLPTPQGWQGWFTNSQQRRYDTKLDVELRIYGTGRAMSAANAHIVAARAITIAEDASVHERNLAFRKLIASMMEAVNAEMEKNIFLYFGSYINYSQNP